VTVSACATTTAERRRILSKAGDCYQRLSMAVSDLRSLCRDAAGMTMIELGVVMGIVTVMLALVLGLSRHVNEIIKVRRAQADLGEWHEALNAWFLKYGHYPDPQAPQFNNAFIESNLVCLVSQNPDSSYYADEGESRRYFRAILSRPLATHDPWGTPYFYRSTTNAYELLSCGPNCMHQYDLSVGTSRIFPSKSNASSRNPNADDLYFEP